MAENGEKSNGFEIQAPGGWAAKASGANVILFLLALTLIAALLYLINVTFQQNIVLGLLSTNQSAIIQTQRELAEQQTKMLTALFVVSTDAKEYQQGVIYVLSLSPEERQKLKLQMPDSIRRLERR